MYECAAWCGCIHLDWAKLSSRAKLFCCDLYWHFPELIIIDVYPVHAVTGFRVCKPIASSLNFSAAQRHMPFTSSCCMFYSCHLYLLLFSLQSFFQVDNALVISYFATIIHPTCVIALSLLRFLAELSNLYKHPLNGASMRVSLFNGALKMQWIFYIRDSLPSEMLFSDDYYKVWLSLL